MADGFQLKFSVEIFPQVVDHLLDSPDGPVGQHVRAAAEDVERAAALRVGTEYSGTTGKYTEARSGRIRDSGKVEPAGDGSAVYIVSFEHPIATMHHEGTVPHTIGADGKRLYNPNDPVRSQAPRSPFRARRQVTHPGTTGNPFLTDAARDVGLRSSGQLRRGSTRQVSIFRSVDTIG
jgi:hypothetical protein